MPVFHRSITGSEAPAPSFTAGPVSWAATSTIWPRASASWALTTMLKSASDRFSMVEHMRTVSFGPYSFLSVPTDRTITLLTERGASWTAS